jgi:hypothetical protein
MERRLTRRRPGWALALPAAVTLAGCGVGGPGGSDGLRGTVIDRSDIQGIPDRPVDEIHIVAVPAEVVPDLLAGVTDEQLDENNRRILHAPLTTDQVSSAGGAVAAVHDGTFELDAGTGTHLVCWLEDGEIWGCNWLDLPETGEISVNFIEGEISIYLAE